MNAPRILQVGEEPPPFDPAPRSARNGGAQGRPKGSSAEARARAPGRFQVLNAFVDFALADLSRAEVAVWLVLYRDTRDGTARTS
jgi:hypothetical protein